MSYSLLGQVHLESHPEFGISGRHRMFACLFLSLKEFTFFASSFNCSTIGLGDITPTQPKYLLMLFIYIIVGLSLVSMCINLIQSEMARTYEVGQLDNLSLNSADLSFGNINQSCDRKRSDSANENSIINGSMRSLPGDSLLRISVNKKKFNKSSQTMLSFPSPRRNLNICRDIHNVGVKFLPRNLSVDDVMKLVDTEEGDILVLTELVRDDSNVSDNSDDGSQSVHSKLLGNYPRISSLLPNSPSTSLIQNIFSNHINLNGIKITPSMHDIETTEEMEDRILLGRAVNMFNSPAVHFRSRKTFKLRVSLVPKGHDVIDEGDEEGYVDEDDENDGNNDDDSHPLEIKFAEEPQASQASMERIRFPLYF
uniref:Ion_trans_2 domain-containing protein n=1 Tax=Loa loa TaxID=7209 RepID=A0A1I7VSF9_LOALO